MKNRKSIFSKLLRRKDDDIEGKKGIVFSLEILLIIGLVGGLFVFILSNLNDGNSRIKVQNATSALIDMTKETQNLFKSQGDFTGISPAVLLNNGVVPEDMVSGMTILSQWNSVVAVAPNTEIGANDTFSMTYPGISSDECSQMVTKASNSFYKIDVAGTLVKDLTASADLNVPSLGTQCATGTTVSIVFYAARY